jgi:hypothetical protein
VYTGYDGLRQLSAAFDDAVDETRYATKHEALESVGLEG